MSTHFRWAALFLLLIVLPAGLLTYVSIQTLRDEQRSALADLNLLVPRLQNAFDQLIDAIAQDTTSSLIVTRFVLDVDGRFLQPRNLPLTFHDRGPAFANAIQQGAVAEFQRLDMAAAFPNYQNAYRIAETEGERAEALNALGRITLAQGDTVSALAYFNDLKTLGDVLDADGAHPLTLSMMRLAQKVPREKAFPLVLDWATGIRDGQIPIHPGVHVTTQILRDHCINRLPHRQAQTLRHLLEHIDQSAHLVQALDQLRPAGLGVIGQRFRSGLSDVNQSLLVALQPQSDGRTSGQWLNLEAISDSLSNTAAGRLIRENGFVLSIFDALQIDDFETRRQQVIHTVTPASATLYRIQFGLYARSDLWVLRRYRERNTLILLGVLGLAGLITVGAFLIYRDITREVALAKLRSEFVSNVSHELRTPLTSIHMYAETLRMGRTRDENQVQTYLDTILQESGRLSRMVGNILDFSRMESGRKTYQFANCEIPDVIRAVVSEYEPVMLEHGFIWQLDIAPDIPVIQADREALESALANLIGNAVKFAHRKKNIAIHARCEKNHIAIEVADRGIGVLPEDRDAIFQKFQRGSNAETTGTGLGLALVKGVMDAHGGTVIYEPRDGGGSVFRLVLPLFGD